MRLQWSRGPPLPEDNISQHSSPESCHLCLGWGGRPVNPESLCTDTSELQSEIGPFSCCEILSFTGLAVSVHPWIPTGKLHTDRVATSFGTLVPTAVQLLHPIFSLKVKAEGLIIQPRAATKQWTPPKRLSIPGAPAEPGDAHWVGVGLGGCL